MIQFLRRTNPTCICLACQPFSLECSLLGPELTDEDVTDACQLAKRYDVASVCAKPCHVPWFILVQRTVS